MKIGLSVVIPAYNEEANIAQCIATVYQVLASTDWDWEIIVVNDGSSDQTVSVVENLLSRWSILRLVNNRGNYGKGYSVRHGALQAAGKIILFSDADLSAPVTEIPKLIGPILNNDCDIAFGSRGIDRSLIGVHQSQWREVSGMVFNLLVRLTIGLPFKDTQCGFKAFRREAALPIFQRQTIIGFGFDPEVLYIGRKQGFRMEEIPVRWNHVDGTTVRFLKDSLKMFLDLLLIRWNDLRGKYN